MLTITLPVAPPANNAFINRKGGHGYGRIKSGRYRGWVKQADAFYMLQEMGRKLTPITSEYQCKMVFPRIRGDLDGRAKLILDWMVSRRLTPDDKFLRNLELTRDEYLGGNLVWIKVWPWITPAKSSDTP